MSQTAQPSMKWHHFITKVGLPLGAVGSVLMAVLYASGYIYESQGLNPSYIYSRFSGVQILDILYAVCLLLCAVFTWQTRTSLKDFRRGAPSMLMTLYALNIGLTVVYTIAFLLAINSDLSGLESLATSLSTSIVGIVINKAYYQKRAHIFVN